MEENATTAWCTGMPDAFPIPAMDDELVDRGDATPGEDAAGGWCCGCAEPTDGAEPGPDPDLDPDPEPEFDLGLDPLGVDVAEDGDPACVTDEPCLDEVVPRGSPEPDMEEAPSADSTADALARMEGLLEGLTSRVSGLEARFDEKIARTEREEAVWARQTEEVERLRSGAGSPAVQSLLLEMADMAEKMDKVLSRVADVESPDVARAVFESLDPFRQKMLDVLEANGMVPFEPVAGEAYDYRTSEIVRPVPTADKAVRKTVAYVLGHGYELDGRVVLRAPVAVFRYDSSLAQPTALDDSPAISDTDGGVVPEP